MEKLVLLPAHTVAPAGLDVIAGAVFIFNVAAVEVAAGEQAPDTTALYW